MICCTILADTMSQHIMDSEVVPPGGDRGRHQEQSKINHSGIAALGGGHRRRRNIVVGMQAATESIKEKQVDDGLQL